MRYILLLMAFGVLFACKDEKGIPDDSQEEPDLMKREYAGTYKGIFGKQEVQLHLNDDLFEMRIGNTEYSGKVEKQELNEWIFKLTPKSGRLPYTWYEMTDRYTIMTRDGNGDIIQDGQEYFLEKDEK